MTGDRSPYVGITGFMKREEINAVLNGFGPEQFGQFKLMVGMLVSSKTMNSLPNRWPGRYPKKRNFGEIFTDNPLCLNIVHFNTDYPKKLAEDIGAIAYLVGENLHGFQLNMAYPRRDQLEIINDRDLADRLILQINAEVLHGCKDNISLIMDYIQQYDDLVTDVLFDMSAGLGRFLDVDLASQFVEAFYTNFGHLNCVLAGGLNAENLMRISSLIRKYPKLSVDAEGQIRIPLDDPSNNTLCISRARAYMALRLSMSKQSISA